MTHFCSASNIIFFIKLLVHPTIKCVPAFFLYNGWFISLIVVTTHIFQIPKAVASKFLLFVLQKKSLNLIIFFLELFFDPSNSRRNLAGRDAYWIFIVSKASCLSASMEAVIEPFSVSKLLVSLF